VPGSQVNARTNLSTRDMATPPVPPLFQDSYRDA